jgi:hypothetical protein
MKLFTEDIFQLLADQTNLYAPQHFARISGVEGLPTFSRYRAWFKDVVPQDTSSVEMKAFVGLILLMGLDRRGNYSLYWTADLLLSMPGFRTVMPRNRFFLLLFLFHLTDNSTVLSARNMLHQLDCYLQGTTQRR